MPGMTDQGPVNALLVGRCLPAHALPASIARIIALTALAALGLSGTPFHEPFHGRGAKALIGHGLTRLR
jgi:hypothetical protein